MTVLLYPFIIKDGFAMSQIASATYMYKKDV